MKKLARKAFEVGVGVNFNGQNKEFLIFKYKKIDDSVLKILDEKIMYKYLALHVDFSSKEEANNLIAVVNIILNIKFQSKELKKSDIGNDRGVFVQVEIEIDHINKEVSTALQADIVHCGVIKQLDNMINHEIFNII